MYKLFFCFFIVLFIGNDVLAQAGHQPDTRHYVTLGYNIGGSSPIPLPDNIRQIKSYSPGFSPSIGYEVIRRVTDKWQVGAGLRGEIKGMTISDSVQYFHTMISMDGAVFEGDFSGTNHTVSRNMYISLPLYGLYQTSDKWYFKLGVYAAYLVRPYFRGDVSNGYIRKGNSLGEKVLIKTATFNFDKEQNRADFGLHLGLGKQIRKYAAFADLQWGLTPLFPSSFSGMNFKMHNIFLTVGVKRELFSF